MSQLLEIIINEINKRGAISFEDFMRLALYCPVYGYYEKEEDTIGRNGDFYTSVSVGNFFGDLLAFQFAEWLRQCQSGTRPVQIVEAGAHRGVLARDILTWLRQNRPELFQSLQYIIIEPSATRQTWQSITLDEFRNQVSWFSRITDHPSGFHGIIFANELLDAMPIRRFGWDAQEKQWFEWGVMLRNSDLAWTRLKLPTAARGRGSMEDSLGCESHEAAPLFELFKELVSVLPDEFTFETCHDASAWWLEAAEALQCGKLITVDYGLATEDLILPERKSGTLRGYYQHHSTSDILANPGEQDLTAHVNFSELIAAGKASGLKTEKFETQAQFLTQIVAHACKGGGFEELDSSRARQFQTLTHPEHLGRSFRVLVQSRD